MELKHMEKCASMGAYVFQYYRDVIPLLPDHSVRASKSLNES